MTTTQIEKVGQLMLLISHRVPHLYLTKLLKLLYLVDENSVRQIGVPITWLSYKAWQYGPVAIAIYDDISFNKTTLFRKYISSEEEEINLPDFHGKGIKIFPVGEIDESVFSEKEIEVINQVLNRYGSKGGPQLVELLHKDHSLWDKVYRENNLEERFKYVEYNTSPFEIDFTELLKGNEEKLSLYRAMEEFMAFTEAFSE